MDNLNMMMECMDEIKEDIKDGVYLKMMNGLKVSYDSQNSGLNTRIPSVPRELYDASVEMLNERDDIITQMHERHMKNLQELAETSRLESQMDLEKTEMIKKLSKELEDLKKSISNGESGSNGASTSKEKSKYDNLTYPELKEICKALGFKPKRSTKDMLEMLNNY